MKNKKIPNGGYIGLLMILLGVSIIIFIIIKSNIFSNKKNGKNIIEQGQDTINQSKNVKALVEQNSKKSLE